MKDVAVMPGRLAAFLGRRERGRTATVERYELMTGGYSRVMAKADVRWNDGSAETVVLRGDPPAGESMLDTDRDDPEAFLARYRDRAGATEVQVNQATVGYFAVVSTVKIFGQILQAASALYQGDRASLVTLYNLNAAAVGHMNFLNAFAELAEPIAALREAATTVPEVAS